MSNLKILVVDDDPVTRGLLIKWLAGKDYSVETAENGLLAIEKLNHQFYDVVITDLVMPGGMDGIGVLEETKRTNIKTEVILITAHASINNAIEAMKKGAADYLQKPINFDELQLRLDKVSNLKMLLKNASDLREAMDVTEKTSAETIQELEILVADKSQQISAATAALMKAGADPQTRIQLALKHLTSQ